MQTTTRIEWLDAARIIAAILMVVDHGLIYFGFSDSWFRYTVTRCVEPIYVFAFGYLMASKGKRLSGKRWLQIFLAAVIETVIHSSREGQLYFGILANLVVVIPVAAWTASLRPKRVFWLAIACSILAVIPIRGPGIFVDYGPALLIGQIAFARVVFSGSHGCLGLLLWAWVASVSGAVGVIFLTGAVGSTFWTVLVGHPVAAGIIWLLRTRQPPKARRHLLRLCWLAEKPLTFYIGHLLGLHLVAHAFGI